MNTAAPMGDAAGAPDPAPARTLDREAIAARIPHAATMCLLDRVLHWERAHLECVGAEARENGAGHPLARAGRLPATAAIEYAAQAMALHGRLVQESSRADGAAPAAPRRGFLAALRGVRLHRRWLDDAAAGPLHVRVERFAGDDVQVLYDFTVHAAGQPVAAGRAVVVLDAVARAGRVVQ